MEKELNYGKIWLTLLRTGIKDRFNIIRREFINEIARNANNNEFIVKSEDGLEEIIKNSPILSEVDNLRELVELAIPKGTKFKHQHYITDGGDLEIEYFANIDVPLSQEFLDKVISNNSNSRIEATCSSVLMESKDVITKHLIIVNEGGVEIKPTEYPTIIKHELTHAILYETLHMIKYGLFDDTSELPDNWSQEDIDSWVEDIKELGRVLDGGDSETNRFNEFVCEFLMYEADGETKVKNPVKETNSKSKTDKQKTTYSIFTPLDRFMETNESSYYQYAGEFDDIIKALNPLYNDYETLKANVPTIY